MKISVPLLFVLFAHAAFSQPELAYNKSFEIPFAKAGFRYWSVDDINGQYSIAPDAKNRHSGKWAVLINSSRGTRMPDDKDAGGFYLRVPKELLTGKKKLKVTAWVKTDSAPARAGFGVLQFKSDGTTLNTAYTDSVRTINGWQPLQTENSLDTTASEVYLTGFLNGKGKAWFDDVQLYIDGQAIKDIGVPAPEPTAAETAWLKKAAIPLLSLDTQSDDKDLDQLFGQVGTAKVIALGEPTHGTGDVFRLRLRMFRYLVEQKGFNTFMLEDELPEAGLLNNYVLNGKDTALTLLKKYFFPVWRNEEMLALIEWMRSYNGSHESKIQFRGVDMQSVRIARQNLLRFGAQYDSSLAEQIRLVIALGERLKVAPADKAKPVNGSINTLANAISNRINKEESLYRTEAPADTVNWAVLNAAVLLQYHQMYNGGRQSGLFRDSCMAANLIHYCRQYPEAKVFVWAHNSHVSRADGMMGNWLARHFD